MTKPRKTTSHRNFRSKLTDHPLLAIALSVVAVAIVVAAGAYARLDFQARRTFDERTAMEPTRELILAATENLGIDAPVEPKTGDIYFPQAGLYLPVDGLYDNAAFRYSWVSETKELTIIDKNVYSSAAAKLIQAVNNDTLFAAVPELQACTRGITVSSDKASSDVDGRKLRQTVQLPDRTLYISSEDACPRNTDSAKLMLGLRSY